MIYDLLHRTSYRYTAPVSVAHHALHLRPRSFENQQVLSVTLHTDPAPDYFTETVDHFGNAVAHVSIDRVHERLDITVEARVDVGLPEPPPAAATPAWEAIRDGLAGDGFPVWVEQSEFVHPSRLAAPSDEVRAYARPSFPPGSPVLAAARDLTRRIFHDFTYDSTATDLSTPLGTVLKQRRGVCQDFAHVQVAAMRAMGLAARYVSGYLRTRPPPGRERLRGADASHAWVAVWCGDLAGWVHLDPTNDLVARNEHVVSAWGRDYSDVSPVRGVILGGGSHNLSVAVDLVPDES